MKHFFEFMERELRVLGVFYIGLWLIYCLCLYGENEFRSWWWDLNAGSPKLMAFGVICAIVFLIRFIKEEKIFKKLIF